MTVRVFLLVFAEGIPCLLILLSLHEFNAVEQQVSVQVLSYFLLVCKGQLQQGQAVARNFDRMSGAIKGHEVIDHCRICQHYDGWNGNGDLSLWVVQPESK